MGAQESLIHTTPRFVVGRAWALVFIVVLTAACATPDRESVANVPATTTAPIVKASPQTGGAVRTLRGELASGYQRWIARRPQMYVLTTDMRCFCPGPGPRLSVVVGDIPIGLSGFHEAAVGQPDDEGHGVTVEGLYERIRNHLEWMHTDGWADARDTVMLLEIDARGVPTRYVGRPGVIQLPNGTAKAIADADLVLTASVTGHPTIRAAWDALDPADGRIGRFKDVPDDYDLEPATVRLEAAGGVPLPVEAQYLCAVVTSDVRTVCVAGHELPVTVDVPMTPWGDLLWVAVDHPDADTGWPLAVMSTDEVRATLAAGSAATIRVPWGPSGPASGPVELQPAPASN